MFKVLGLKLFHYKVKSFFFFIVFGLSSKLETDQAFQPPVIPRSFNIAWTKNG